MTKIRNTKKGMAKKTLSISLAVAMLATSNVPVWAAEDLFTDGEVAVETVEAPVEDVFSDAAEEVVEEAPVVEDNTEDVVDAQATDPTWESKYTAEYKEVPSSIEWDDEKIVKVRVWDNVAEEYVTDNSKLGIRYLDSNGQLGGDYGNPIQITGTPDAEGYYDFKIDFQPWVAADKSFVGKEYFLQVVNTDDKHENGYAQKSTGFKLEKATLKGSLSLVGPTEVQRANWDLVTYTGKPVVKGPVCKNPAGIWGEVTTWTEKPSDERIISETLLFEEDQKIIGKNIIDAYRLSEKKLTSVMTIKADLYRGTISVDFAIEPKYITKENFKDNIKITLSQNEYEYTGSRIVEDNEKALVVDLNRNDDKKVLKDALDGDGTIWLSDNDKTAVGEYDVVNARIDTSADSLKNFWFSPEFTSNNEVPVSGTYKVIPRDLNNAASTKVVIKTVNNENLQTGEFGTYLIAGNPSQDGLWNNLEIIDVRTGDPIQDDLYGDIELKLEKEPFYVKTGEKREATVKAKTTNVKADAVAEFRVVAHDMADAWVEKENKLKEDAVYTGSQITKGITKDNFFDKFGAIKERDENGKNLGADTEYSTTPAFGENLNAYTATNTEVGEGQIIINGLVEREGTQKVITFKINPRPVAKINVPASVPFDATLEEAKEYELETSVTTAEFKDEGVKKTLTAPASDYKVTYEFVKDDKVTPLSAKETPVAGYYIKTTIEKNPKAVRSNFDFKDADDLVAYTKLAKKEITKENVVLNKDTYTYTGKDAVVDFDVVYNGEKLVDGEDYISHVVNGKDVGTGTLVVTGKGDFEASSVSLEFAIVPAKTSDVKVALDTEYVPAYNGNKWEPKKEQDMTLRLNGVDVSNDFKVSYPTAKTANVNAGDGEIFLVPANKNFDSNGTVTFKIKPATLTDGTLKAYNAKESQVVWYVEDQDPEFRFTFDGSAKEYAKTIYVADAQGGKKVVTADDYTIKYVDNVHGQMTYATGHAGRGFALVIAKGNYINKEYNLSVDGKDVVKNGVYTCEDGTKIANVVQAEAFLIDHLAIHKSNVTVNNAQYSEGRNVDPVVTINYNGKILVKDVDFALDYEGLNSGKTRTEVTNGKTLEVKLAGKGGYYLANDVENEKFAWGIEAFDLANAEIIVSGTDAAPVVKVLNRGVVIDPKNYDLVAADGKVTVTATKDNKNYTGSKTEDIKAALVKPEKPMLVNVDVVGNKATAVLSGESEGAVGYDYVYGARDCIETKDYVKVNKNKLTTNTAFTYVPQGTYYAYCHAWTRDENGKKVFSDWSNPYIFTVTAVTPEKPAITDYKVNGNTVTVTYTKAANADGYDVVLGTTYGTVADERRPLQYGELVKKNIKGNTVTATFKNVPKGTYYAGLHAFNRTSEDGKKVFSPWSDIKTIKVK